MSINTEIQVKTSRAAILTALLFVIGTVASVAVAATRVAPSITNQPTNQTVIAGREATFSVAATGTGFLSYQWEMNQTAIVGARSSSYETPATSTSENGARFTVVVSNRAGFVTSSIATLTVNSAIVAPSITTQPASETVIAGQMATFTVATIGTAPLTYQWSKNGAPISRATSSTYQDAATATSDNGSRFAVAVSNAAGRVTSNFATLTVDIPVTAPSITSQPASQAVTAGQTATFTVAATGTGPLYYQWLKNGAAISRATSSTYQLVATASNNGSQFTVSVSNSTSRVTSSIATLTVDTLAVAPSITSQPSGQTVTAGQMATFAVTATGTGPLSYQWLKNSGQIKGANSAAYQTPATVASDSGTQFAVVISNTSGSVTSNSTTLTVNAAGTFLLSESSAQLNFGSVAVSGNSTQTVTLTNVGNSNVTISTVSISGAGFSAGGGAAGLILSAGQTAPVTVTFSPSAPGNVTGSLTITSTASNSVAPISLSGTGAAPHSVSLNWTASTSQVTGYNVYSSNVSGGPYAKLSTSPVAVTNYSDGSVQAAQTYYYVTTAVDSNNNESIYSQEASAIIP